MSKIRRIQYFIRDYEIVALAGSLRAISHCLQIVLTIYAKTRNFRLTVLVRTARRKAIANFKGTRAAVDCIPREIPGVPRNLSPVCLNINEIECPFEMRPWLTVIKGNKLMKGMAIGFSSAL